MICPERLGIEVCEGLPRGCIALVAVDVFVFLFLGGVGWGREWVG